MMLTKDIIQLILGSGGLLTILFVAFKCGKIVKSIEAIDKRLEKVEAKLGEISEIKIQIVKLELIIEQKSYQQFRDMVEKQGIK